MTIKHFLKSLGGRTGNKTRSKGKVNTKRNKRASNKAIRLKSGKEIQDGFFYCLSEIELGDTNGQS